MFVFQLFGFSVRVCFLEGKGRRKWRPLRMIVSFVLDCVWLFDVSQNIREIDVVLISNFFLFQQLRRSWSICLTGHRKQKATLEGSRPIAGRRFRRPVERQKRKRVTQLFCFLFIHAAHKFSEKKQYEEEEEWLSTHLSHPNSPQLLMGWRRDSEQLWSCRIDATI